MYVRMRTTDTEIAKTYYFLPDVVVEQFFAFVRLVRVVHARRGALLRRRQTRTAVAAVHVRLAGRRRRRREISDRFEIGAAIHGHDSM